MARKPSGYSTELGTLICERIAGGENVIGICKDQDMPCAATIFKWIRDKGTDKKSAEFCDMYDRATVERTEALGEQTLAIADDCPETKEGVLKARLKTEVRFKHMSMLRPKKFGKLSQVDITSGGEKVSGVGEVVFNIVEQQHDGEQGTEARDADVETVSETSQE